MNPAFSQVEFPPAPPERPWIYINMVTTIDGKILTGDRDEKVMDLGSAVDHATMRVLERASDAVLIGAGTLRATPGLWYPAPLKKLVLTSGRGVDFGARFFTDDPDLAYVVTTAEGVAWPHQYRYQGAVDWADLFRRLRTELGVERLLIEGGSELNGAVLATGLVDELFMTLAPKVKLGRDVPTYAGGEALPREEVQKYQLLTSIQVEDELFLRYRRVRTA